MRYLVTYRIQIKVVSMGIEDDIKEIKSSLNELWKEFVKLRQKVYVESNVNNRQDKEKAIKETLDDGRYNGQEPAY